jgi:carbon-monoxide dehydrogenase medium subunit
MFCASFLYHRPSTVAEAVSLLAADPDARVLAGGHSLLPPMKLRLATPSAVVDIGRIPGLVGA